MQDLDEEILNKMPKSWQVLRNIWIKKEGSSVSALKGDNQYGSGQKQ